VPGEVVVPAGGVVTGGVVVTVIGPGSFGGSGPLARVITSVRKSFIGKAGPGSHLRLGANFVVTQDGLKVVLLDQFDSHILAGLQLCRRESLPAILFGPELVDCLDDLIVGVDVVERRHPALRGFIEHAGIIEFDADGILVEVRQAGPCADPGVPRDPVEGHHLDDGAVPSDGEMARHETFLVRQPEHRAGQAGPFGVMDDQEFWVELARADIGG